MNEPDRPHVLNEIRCPEISPKTGGRCILFDAHDAPHVCSEGARWRTGPAPTSSVWALADKLEARGWMQSALDVEGVAAHGLLYVHAKSLVGIVITCGAKPDAWFASIVALTHRSELADADLDYLEQIGSIVATRPSPALAVGKGRTFGDDDR